MKCFKNIRYALILFFMLLVGVASGGFFAPYKVTKADTQVKQNAIYQDETKDSFAVVHNHTLATGVFEEGVTYYYNAGGSEYVELESDYYTIGDSIVDYESDVYVIASTYSVYKYESGNPVLICDTIECFGKSNAMDTYKNSYALLAIVDNATTHAIEINVGRTLLLTGEVYGTLTTQDYIYFYSDYDFYLYGSLQLTNENNTANYAIYLREGNLYTYANITSLSKPALVSAGSGSITVYGNISSNADATIHIPSSSYNTDALNVYANVENIAQGSAILNESQRQINLFEGRIKASGIALKNQSTGTVNASVNEYGLVIESTGSYAIYNNLSATIDLNGGNHILDIKANYNDAIYLNKGNLYAYHIQVENISPTGNIINAVNNGTSSVVNIDSVRFTLPNSGSGYHIYNNNVSSANIGQIYLSGASTFSGGNATIYSKTFDSVNAVSYVNQNNIYNGDIVSIACKGSNGGLLNDTDLNKVVVKNVSQANKHLFTLASGGNYALKHDGTSLKIGYVYRVTYMANGADSGQVPEDNNTYDRLATVTVLDANLQRVGYEFDGWTYNATAYKPNDIVSITQNITFVAKWKEKVYTMSYYVEDALVYTDTYTISTTTKTLYEDLSNPGYEVYWLVEDEGNYHGWDYTENYRHSVTMDKWYGDVKLNAFYDIISYTVTFVKDGEIIKDYTTYFDVTSETFTLNYSVGKVGYYFFGWVGENYTNPTNSITVNQGTTKNLVYTAYFEEKSYIYYVVNLEENFYAYTYTMMGSVVDLIISNDMAAVLNAIDIDRMQGAMQSATLYLGQIDNKLVVRDKSSIVFATDALDITAYVEFDIQNPFTLESYEYSQQMGNNYSYYNFVINSAVTLRLNSFTSNVNTNIYVDELGVCDIYTANLQNGVYGEYNAIYNKGTINTIGNITINKGNLYNIGNLNIKSTLNINKTNYIYNGNIITFFDKGNITQEATNFVYEMGLIDNLAINNNGALIMHANTTITNTIFTRVCSDSVYIDIPISATKTYKVAVLVDTYSISKIVTTNVDTDTIELVGVVENNTLKQNFVIRSNFDGLYIHKVYKIVYNFGGGNYLYETQEFSVVDQDSYIVISHNNLSKAGYTFDGIYRYKNNKYIDINGLEKSNLYDASLVLENAWQEIEHVGEDYTFVVRWQIEAPILYNNDIFVSSTTYNGDNYIYTTVSNLSQATGVTYTYAWYKSSTYGGNYTLVATTNESRLTNLKIADTAYYYVVVTVSDGVSSRYTTSNIKSINIRNANIAYDMASYSGVYDGNYHKAEIINIVTVDNIEYSLTYSLDNETFVSSAYELKDYTQGDITIYFKITAASHNEATGTLTINIEKRAITITASSNTSVYGDAIVTPTATITSGELVNANDLGTISAETDASARQVATYATSAKYMQNNNYAVTTIDGVYRVTKKDLIVTCENKTVVYGGALPNYTYVIDGFVSGDSESVLQGEAHFSTIYTDKRGIGEYDILISGFNSDNYNIIYENGVITVTPATITYTLNNYVGEYDNKYHSIYVHNITTVNNMEPTIKYSRNGGQTFNQSSAELFKNVIGEVEVWFKITATNHIDIIDKGIISISKRNITITIDDITVKYMDNSKTLTCSVTSGSLADGETLKTLGVTLSREQGIDPGEYKITATHTTTNYSITYINGKYTINAVDIESSDGNIILTATAGLSPDIVVVSTNSYKSHYKDFNTSQVAGEHTEIIQAYTLTTVDKDGKAYKLPSKSYTIKLRIAEEYRDREKFTVVCNYNQTMLVVLKATREGDYLVFSTGMIGEYFIITDMEKDYAIVPIIFAAIILIALVVLYILQCVKLRDKEVRIMSFGGIMLLVYVPLISKAIILSLLMLIVFMIFLNAVKFMSIITIDVDSLKSKIKSSTKQKEQDSKSSKDDDSIDNAVEESNDKVDDTLDAESQNDSEDSAESK